MTFFLRPVDVDSMSFLPVATFLLPMSIVVTPGSSDGMVVIWFCVCAHAASRSASRANELSQCAVPAQGRCERGIRRASSDARVWVCAVARGGRRQAGAPRVVAEAVGCEVG